MKRLVVAVSFVLIPFGCASEAPPASPAPATTPSPAEQQAPITESLEERAAEGTPQGGAAVDDPRDGEDRDATGRRQRKPGAAATGLGNKAGDDPAPPADVEPEQDEVLADAKSGDAALVELDRLESKLRAAGVTLGDARDARFAATAMAKNERLSLTSEQCGDVCTLTESICRLETRICAMVSQHPDDPRYADACARSRSDCELGTSACTACKG